MSKPSKPSANSGGDSYIGISGRTFEPCAGCLYPEKLTQAKELAYAASKLTSIEINGTYSQCPWPPHQQYRTTPLPV